MQLRLESRPVGDVLIVQCHGRIVAGNEVFTLHSSVGDSIVKYGDVVLQLDQIEFVDSSGLGRGALKIEPFSWDLLKDRGVRILFLATPHEQSREWVPQALANGLIYPPRSHIFDASQHVATKLAEYIFDHDLARVPRPADIAAHIKASTYRPVYPA